MSVIPDTDDSIVARIASPAFSLPHPEVFGIGHMTRPELRACRVSWDRGLFPAQDVLVRRYANVFVVREGLVVRAEDLSAYRSSVTQQTPQDIADGLAQLGRAIDDGSVARCHGSYGLCVKPGSDNYGHWLLEMMPKAAIYREHVADRPIVAVVPNATGPLGAVIDNSLAMLGIPDGRLVKVAEPMWFEELHNVQGLTNHGVFMSPVALRAARRLATSVEGRSGGKVFVSRRGHRRSFRRDEELEAALTAEGWRIARPGEMSLHDQIALFASADRIAGSMGAGMANIVFAAPGCRVTIFSPGAMADTFYWFLAGLAGHRYREVRCPVSGPEQGRGDRDRDLDITVDEVLRHLI